MHENIFARLPADKAVALGIIEPLYCSLFHVFIVVPFLYFTLEGVGRTCRLLAVEARTAHHRFSLTYATILRADCKICNKIALSRLNPHRLDVDKLSDAAWPKLAAMSR